MSLSNWLRASTLAVGLLAAFQTSARAACEDGEVVVRVAIGPSAQTAVRDRAARGLAVAIDGKLQGRACAQLLSDPAAYSGAAALDALGKVADIALPDVAVLAQRVPAFRIYDVPFAFRGLTAVDLLSSGPTGNALASAVAAQGLRSLGLLHQEMEQIAAKQDVVLPSDLLGRKTAYDGSAFGSQWLAEAGAPPQNMAGDGLEAALKEARADAVLASWQQINALPQDTALTTILETNHRYRGYLIVADAAWWRGLAPDLAKDLAALVTAEAKSANAFRLSQVDRAKQAILRGPRIVRGLTRKQRDAWLERVSGTWAVAEKEIGLSGLWDRLQAANSYP